MNESKRLKVRDFIYLDIPKLYSMYSQVFEGVIEHIVQDRLSQELTGEKQASLTRSASVETQALEASRRTESGILHHHMYNRLEEALESVLVDASTMDAMEISKVFLSGPLIKVVGPIEIEDYARLQQLLENFNSLGELIAYSSVSTEAEHINSVLQTYVQLAEETIPKNKKLLEEKMRKLTDAKAVARTKGLLLNPKFLENLTYFAKLFNPSGYEVIVTPSKTPNVQYRGVLNQEELRYSPARLSSLYGGQSEAPWTMVGMVTHAQDINAHNSHEEEVVEASEEVSLRTPEEQAKSPMMLDSFRAMFKAGRTFERMFLESDKAVQVVVSPLAIYREFEILR